ncbi:phosphonate C-P lyase system protein PhnG [Dictyobacter sp. S3.2.2.5]|uniref:Phosphonate C-P lyase system protein PhnG n=1 Tax=Dictyobacter halimunensis TaxID=3026934 RepID=A0ABQ6FHN9_9CHLR|nr:phosphonate C-P lyase system protein PhnG [Dictyobacter sp. S3.2.2.5]
MDYYRILANSREEQVCRLASTILEHYTKSQVKLLSGPRQGLVMLRVRETVADSLFNAGEVLVTEVKLELDDQFGFGMVIGDCPRHALGVALVDAALRKGGSIAEWLTQELAVLDTQLAAQHHKEQALVASTRVEFERM